MHVLRSQDCQGTVRGSGGGPLSCRVCEMAVGCQLPPHALQRLGWGRLPTSCRQGGSKPLRPTHLLPACSTAGPHSLTHSAPVPLGRKQAGIWVTYKDGVYDVTRFAEQHPGGMPRLMLAAGGAIDPFWAMYQQHNTEQVGCWVLDSEEQWQGDLLLARVAALCHLSGGVACWRASVPPGQPSHPGAPFLFRHRHYDTAMTPL